MKKLGFAFCLLLSSPFCFVNGAPAVKQDVVQLLIPKLNSDRIAYFFGSYGVDPIQVNASPFGESRIANLYSLQGDQKIMRTLAIVDFKQPIPEDLKQAHQCITQGQSIGIALREKGWSIEKLPLYFGTVALSPALKAWMHESSCNSAAVHFYQLNVLKEDRQPVPYCTIIEVHSPQYLDASWLQALYFGQYQDHQEASGEAAALIGSLNLLITEFPYP